MVPWERRAHSSIARLAKRREGLGASCLTEPTANTKTLPAHRQINTMQNLSKHATATGRESGCQNTTSGHISHSDKPQAGQMNFTRDCIEKFYRRVLSGHMVIPEAVA